MYELAVVEIFGAQRDGQVLNAACAGILHNMIHCAAFSNLSSNREDASGKKIRLVEARGNYGESRPNCHGTVSKSTKSG
jgi:hypothetical protein